MRKMGKKVTAAVLTALMTFSPVMGEAAVYAMPETVGEEDLAGGTYEQADDLPDTAVTEDAAGTVETSDLIYEADGTEGDPADAKALTAEDTEALNGAEDTDVKEENEALDGSEAGEPSDEEVTGADDISSPGGETVIPVTEGRVLRLADYGTGIQKDQHIYFGHMDQNAYNYWDPEGEQKPYWRVLDPEKDNTGAGNSILVMSEMLWGNNPDKFGDGGIAFNADREKGTAWKGSDAKNWCGSFLANVFTENERAAIKAVSKKDEAVTGEWKVGYLENDKVFFLSVQELEQYLGALATEYQAQYTNRGIEAWWLRNPAWSIDKAVAAVKYFIQPLDVSGERCARPAFNINRSNILFTSAAYGGKVSGAPGATALVAVADKGTRDWKLTIKDTSRAFSAAREGSGNVAPGSVVKVRYTGAKPGSNEYVSAVLCDSTGTALFYGRLVNNSVSGTVDVTLPQSLDAGNTYKLHVFSEQYNGDNRTDFASGMSTIDLKIPMSIKDTVLAKTELKYNGNVRIPAVTTLSGKRLTENVDYTKVIKKKGKKVNNPKSVGTYKMTLKGIGNFYGTVTFTYKIVKANNTLKVRTKKVTYNYKLSRIKSRDAQIKGTKLYRFTDTGVGKLSYSLYSAKKGSKNYKSKFKVNSKTGMMTVKKGLGKGTYRVKVKVKAKGNKSYKPKTVTLSYKIVVKK